MAAPSFLAIQRGDAGEREALHELERRAAAGRHVADAIAELCLEDPRVERVDVTVDKLSALRFARSVAVEISRARSNG